jgi:integrase/recombinase XerC
MLVPAPQIVKVNQSPLMSVSDAEKSGALWEEFLRVQLKPRTRQEYGKAIQHFCQVMAPVHEVSLQENWPASRVLAEFLALTKAQAIGRVLEYRQELVVAGLATATINLRLSALKSFVRYAHKRDECTFLLDEIKSLKSQPYRDTSGVGADAYRSVLAEVDRSTSLGCRDYGILRLLWDNALRREEVVNLDLEDFDRLGKKLLVRGKGRLDKEAIDLNNAVEEAVSEWITCRSLLVGAQDCDALLLSCNGRRLAGTDILRILQKYSKRAGVKLSPHQVRHSSITAFLDVSNGDVRSAQALSRHSDIKTLMIYDDQRKNLQKGASQKLGDLLTEDVKI